MLCKQHYWLTYHQSQVISRVSRHQYMVEELPSHCSVQNLIWTISPPCCRSRTLLFTLPASWKCNINLMVSQNDAERETALISTMLALDFIPVLYFYRPFCFVHFNFLFFNLLKTLSRTGVNTHLAINTKCRLSMIVCCSNNVTMMSNKQIDYPSFVMLLCHLFWWVLTGNKVLLHMTASLAHFNPCDIGEYAFCLFYYGNQKPQQLIPQVCFFLPAWGCDDRDCLLL